MTLNEAQELFSAMCQANEIPEISFDETDSATLPFGSEGLALHVQYRRNEGDIVLIAPVGGLPDDASAVTVLKNCLAANLYWRGTFGATFAWIPAFGQLALEYALPVDGLTAESLAVILSDFLTAVESCSQKLAQPVENQETAPANGAEAGLGMKPSEFIAV